MIQAVLQRAAKTESGDLFEEDNFIEFLKKRVPALYEKCSASKWLDDGMVVDGRIVKWYRRELLVWMYFWQKFDLNQYLLISQNFSVYNAHRWFGRPDRYESVMN